MKILVAYAIIVFMHLTYGLKAGNPINPTAPAKTITISGVVTDVHSGEALAGAQVEVEGAGLKVFTNLEGKFNLTLDAKGAVNIKVKYISYEEASIKNIGLSAAEKPLQVKLQPK